MKITVVGTMVCLESSHSCEEIRKVANRRPAALNYVVTEGNNKNILYTLSANGTPGINSRSITFEKNGVSGKACLMIPLPAPQNGENIKETVARSLGSGIVHSIVIDSQIDRALNEINNEDIDIQRMIEVTNPQTDNTAVSTANANAEG